MRTEEYMNGWEDAIIEINKLINKELESLNHGKTMFAKYNLPEYVDIPDYKISILLRIKELINKLT
jgi:hypothetical protein